MTTVATRLITLILSLQRQPGQKAADLAEKLGVSVRTLHRYFEMLDEMGVPVYAERGPYGGFSLVRGYKLPPLVFTPQEAVAIALGTSLVHEMWGTLYHEEAQGALTKLDNILPDEQRQEIAWARRALIATGMNRADIQILAPSLEKLRRAVRENRRLSMTYHSGTSPHGEQRELDPYALVHSIGWWYVVGWCHLRKALRTFRVDRVAALTLTDQNFSIPADFDIHAYLAQEWIQSQPLKVTMRFAPDFAHLAQYGRGYWEALSEEPDGAVTVTFSAPDVHAAAANVLAYGPAVEALEPPEVRQMVHARASETAKLYENLSTTTLTTENDV
jgi:predicted DNA-binding transcriptional regulator YafY